MRLAGRTGATLVIVEIVLVVVFVILGFWVRVQPWFVADRIIHLVPLISSSPFRDYGYLHGNDPWIEYWIADRLWSKGLAYWSCLKPNCDRWTKLFWYPWGRDFTRSEYPLLPMFAAATYGLVRSNISLQAWIALIPPLTGAFLVVVSYVVGRLLFGRLAGIIAALLVAFLPANMDRTMAGFVEKEGFALPLVLLSIGILGMALRHEDFRKSVVFAVIGGFVGGLVGFAWGGYRFTLLAAAIAGMLSPLFLRELERVQVALKVIIVFVVVNGLLLVFSPVEFAGLKLVAGVLAAALMSYAVWYYLEKVVSSKRVYVNVVRLYAGFILIVFLAAIVASILGIVPVNLRVLYALAWPLRGLLRFPPLVASVAEHYPPSLHTLVNGLGIALVLSPFGILFSIWRAYRRGDVGSAALLVVAAGAYWAMFGMAYFLQTGAVFSAIATASLFAFFEEMLTSSSKRKKVVQIGMNELRRAGLVLLVAAVVISSSLAGYAEYARLSHTATSVLTGGAGLGVNPGWFVLLDVINTTTPKDAVVVTWWDYGYWITVPTARATLADGATINGTQISLLGRILTGSEQESSELMKELGLKPGKTYVMVHEVVLVNETSGEVIFEPLFYRVDIPKSYWMLRIGGRDPANYFSSMIEDVGGGRKILMYTVDFGKKAVREALIYKMLVDAAYRLGDKTRVLTDLKIEKIDKVIVPAKDNNNNMIRIVAPKPELKEFKPWKIIAYSFPVVVGKGLRPVLLIAFYQWTG